MALKQLELRLDNDTFTNITKTSITNINDSDWEENCGPDKILVGVAIKSKSSAQRSVKIKKDTKDCSFTMTLHFEDGTEDTFQINQTFVPGYSLNFERVKESHLIGYENKKPGLIKIFLDCTPEQKMFAEIEELIKKGETATRKKQYEKAIEKFIKASLYAVGDKQINSIKELHANACFEYGKSFMEKGWNLENNGTKDITVASSLMFAEALGMFIKAQDLSPTRQQKKMLQIAKMKYKGNRFFKIGNKFETFGQKLLKEASKLKDDSECQNKYREALKLFTEAKDNYTKAKEAFDEGPKEKNFLANAKRAADKIVAVSKNLSDVQAKVK